VKVGLVRLAAVLVLSMSAVMAFAEEDKVGVQ
jgi:hypothetical protein